MATFNGTTVADQLRGTVSDDQISGLDGDDVIFGGAGADTISGGAGGDRFNWVKGDGSDVVEGGAGADTQFLTGTAGSEAFALSTLGTHVSVSDGFAELDLHGVETLNLKTLGGQERIVVDDLRATDVRNLVIDVSGASSTGNGSDIYLLGSATAANVVTVQALSASSARVTGLAGGIQQTTNLAGLDSLDRVTVEGGAGDDNLTISGNVTSAATFVVLGGAGNDTTTGSSGSEFLYGHGGEDLLNGGAGDDYLDGGASADTLNGGAGNDTILGGSGGDQIFSDFRAGVSGLDVIDGGANLPFWEMDVATFATTNAADSIVVSHAGSHTTASLNGVAALDLANIEQFILRPGAGADRIDLGLFAEGGTSIVDLDLSGATAGQGDGQSDSILLTTEARANFISVAMLDQARLQVLEQVDFPTATPMMYATVSALEAADQVTLNAAEGDDRILVGKLFRTHLTVDGGAGSDTATLNVASETGSITVSNNASHVVNGFATVDLSNVETLGIAFSPTSGDETLTVNGGLFEDNYDVFRGTLTVPYGPGVTGTISGPGSKLALSSLFNSDRIVINGAEGNDSITWRGGAVTFDGGSDFDSAGLVLREGARISVSNGWVSVARDFGGPLDLHGVERLDMFGDQTGVTYTFGDLTGSELSLINVSLRGQNINGTADAVNLSGTAAADSVTFSHTASTVSVSGLQAAVAINAWSAADLFTFDAGQGNDTVNALGTSTLNRLFGGEGDDILLAGASGNLLIGGTGNDTIRGGAGADYIQGDQGNDLLTGGAGNDGFSFGGLVPSRDIITDFTPHDAAGGHDWIALGGFGVTSFAELKGAGRIFQSGADVVITTGDQLSTITLKNISLSSLSAADFYIF